MSSSDPPITTHLTLGELLCAFAYAGDLAFGLQLDDSLRACYLADRLAERLGLPDADRAAVYYTALLKDSGCTAWTTELASAWQTDEIVARRELLIFTNPRDRSALISWMTRHVARDQSRLERLSRYVNFLTNSKPFLAEGRATTFVTACRIATRLGLPDLVQAAMLSLMERWDGGGAPSGLRGEGIPRTARVVFPTFFLIPVHRVSGREAAVQLARASRGQAFDPDVVDAFLDLAGDKDFWTDLEAERIRDLVIALEPGSPFAAAEESRIEDVALAFADFVDLKSRFAAAHSRRVASLSEALAQLMDCPPSEVTQIRRAALMHDLGLVGLPSYSLERPWRELSETDRDQYRLHPYHGERILRQIPSLQPLAEMVGSHQERADGSGYYRGMSGAAISLGARIISVADRLDELTHDAPGEAAHPATEALAQMRREPFDPAVLAALGKELGEPQAAKARTPRPAGLTEREVEILQLACSGLTRQAIARRLYLSENTVRHHLEHVYNKTGTSNRVSATLFAMEHGLLSVPSS